MNQQYFALNSLLIDEFGQLARASLHPQWQLKCLVF